MLKELLAIHEAKCKSKTKKMVKKIAEGEDDEDLEKKDLGELIEQYCDANKMYHWEGSRGVSNFEKLIGILGYQNVDYFLTDNSGCLEAMVEWIKDAGVTEWKESMAKDLEDNKE
jgi:hypothetical protein